MKNSNYLEQFNNRYNQSTEQQYGSADISAIEIHELKFLYKKIYSQLKATSKLSGNKVADRRIVRQYLTQYIVDNGWFSNVEEATAFDLAETAITHACVVAEHLIINRGKESSPNTVWSYATKNQFDRFVRKHLSRKVLKDWNRSINREKNYSTNKVKYPTNVDQRKIYGVGKPQRFWQAQLLKNLEAIHLGRMDEKALGNWDIDIKDIEKFKIPWIKLQKTIEGSKSVDDLTSNILTETMLLLQKNGVSDNQILNVVINSYGPKGVIAEHGVIPEITKVWEKILRNISSRRELRRLRQPLLDQLNDRLSKSNIILK